MSKIETISDKWAEMHSSVSMPPVSPGAQVSSLPRNARVTLQYKRRSIPTRTMVNAAIKSQRKGPRDGVSFIAIKKYIARNYQASLLDVNSRLRYVKRYILNALENGKLVRTRGTGVCGSFRLPLHPTLKKSMKRTKKKRTTVKKMKAIKTELEKRMKANNSAADQSQQLVKTVSKLSLRRTNSRSTRDLTAK